MPSAPEIEEVRPFSSTAVVKFAEPASTGGVPVLRYKVEWRLPGSPDWTSDEYKPGNGKWIWGKKSLCAVMESPVYPEALEKVAVLIEQSVSAGCY